jgi:hypothetical protein
VCKAVVRRYSLRESNDLDRGSGTERAKAELPAQRIETIVSLALFGANANAGAVTWRLKGRVRCLATGPDKARPQRLALPFRRFYEARYNQRQWVEDHHSQVWATLREVAAPPVGPLAASESGKTRVWPGLGSVLTSPTMLTCFRRKGRR